MDVRASSFDAPVERLYGREFKEIFAEKPVSALLAEGSQVTVYQGGRLR
jgi:hypothetical protein